MNLGLHRLAKTTVLMTWLLLWAGALVTGTGSGLAVPDWPLSYGQFFPPMVGGVFFEHGHRLVAGTVLLLTLFFSLGLWKFESRGWVRKLGFFALGIVLLQALLGGLTVLLKLPVVVSVTHACIAQLFFSLTLVLAMVTSPAWKSDQSRASVQRGLIANNTSKMKLARFSLVLNFCFLLQLILGASMRHLGAGLAVPDFPTMFGSYWPEISSVEVFFHIAHRFFAFILAGLVVCLVMQIFQKLSSDLELVAWSGGLLAVVVIQIFFGIFTIWLRRPIWLTSAHLATGAVCLALSIGLTLKLFAAYQLGSKTE